MGYQTRRTLVEREGSDFPLTTQATVLGVSRSSRSYHPVSPSPEEGALNHRIDASFTEWPFYGSRRITAQLRREGSTINRKAVHRHLRERGLAAMAPGPNLSRRHPEHEGYPSDCRSSALIRSGAATSRLFACTAAGCIWWRFSMGLPGT